MLIDTHAHLNFQAYKDDLEQVIKRTLAHNVWVINVGSKYETSKKAVEIAEKHEKGMYAAVGLHPIYSASDFVKMKTDPEEGDFLAKEENFHTSKYRSLAQSSKVVAIGEIGLDYYYKPKTKKKLELFKEKQKQVFIEQLNLAKELNLPIILHCRTAHSDLIEILRFQVSSFRFQGVVHCFTGSWEQAKEYLDMGFYLGINVIIDKLDLTDVIKKAPLEKILVETDCPYLTPKEEGDKRNEPIFVRYIVQKIAKIENLDEQKVAEITTLSARKLFNLQD